MLRTTSPGSDPSRATAQGHIIVSRASTRSTANRIALAAGSVTLMAAIAGCGSSEPTAAPAPDKASATNAAPVTTAEKIDAITGGKTVNLTDMVGALPDPPAPFTQADMEAFADRAIDLTRRGISPELAGKTPTQAFDFVFANQFPESRAFAKKTSEDAAGDYDWEWAWASLFAAPPTAPPKVLDARWQVGTAPGQLADGTKAKRLQLTLSTSTEYLVPNTGSVADADAVSPIVVQRAITISGYKPLGGRSWWPAIGIQAGPLFGGICALVNGSLLTTTPNLDAATMKKNYDTLDTAINNPQKVDVNENGTGNTIADTIAKNCEN